MPEKQGEGDPSTKASHQKSLCVNRIQFAWNRHIEDILDRNYYPTGDFGLDTLRKLAALAESEPLSRVKPILLSCIHERANNEAHDGHSRAKGLTRADVLKAKDIIEQQNWVPHAKDVVRKKRALSYTCAESASPDSPPTKCARPRSLVAFRIRTDTSKSLDALRTSHGELDLSPEIAHNERAATTSNRLPKVEETDDKGSLPGIFNMNNSGLKTGTANDMDSQDGHPSLHTERDNDMIDGFPLDPPFSDPWRDHNWNDSTHNFNGFDPPKDSNPPNINMNLESLRGSLSCDPPSNTLLYSNSTNVLSRASCEVTPIVRSSISQMSPIDVNLQVTHMLHDLYRQFKADTDSLREILANNLTRAQKDLDDAQQAVQLFKTRLQEAHSRRDTANQTYQSAQLRSQQAQTAYNQHEALKEFNKDTAFRSDINTLAEQLRSKWTEIEEESEKATTSMELAHTAAMEQARALQQLEATEVPLRVREQKAKGAWDACKETLKRIDNAKPGLTEMMMRTSAGILPQDVLTT